MIINLPEEVGYIIERLNKHGYEGFAVGGCVRDRLLGREPEDWDIATNALPQKVLELFSDVKTIPTGLRHGTITVVLKEKNFEITTYRVDGEYSDSRRPDKVSFSDSIEEDLKRRDFTINAMAYNNHRGVVDPYGGQLDLKEKVIRCVGNADERFSEDALRMMRAVRFSAQLGFELSDDTRQAVIKNMALLQKVSRERVASELVKILISDFPGKVRELAELGLMNHIMPEFKKCIGFKQQYPGCAFTLDEHTYRTIENVERDIVLRLAALLHDIGIPETGGEDRQGMPHPLFFDAHTPSTGLRADHKGISQPSGHGEISAGLSYKILKDLRFDNNTINSVVKLVENHDAAIENSRKSICKWLEKMGNRDFERLLKLKKAGAMAQNPDNYKKNCEEIEKVRIAYEELVHSKQCLGISDLAINGDDLISLGLMEGKDIGNILKGILDLVLENPELNTRDTLISIVRSKYFPRGENAQNRNS
jgi:tRNA nucleotidyltransferase (CCA-adding enzyme)